MSDHSERRPQGRGDGRARSPAVAAVALVVATGLVATGVLAWAATVAGDRNTAAELTAIAEDVRTRVGRSLTVAEAALSVLGGHLAVAGSGAGTLQRVLENTSVIEDAPGVLAMAYANAEHSLTGELWAVSVEAIHPRAANEPALGRDLLAEPERRRAVLAARDSGRISATSVVTHVDGGVDAILLVAPVYRGESTLDGLTARRAAFVGVTFAVVSPTVLFGDAVGSLPICLEVTDGGAANVVPRLAAPVTMFTIGDAPAPNPSTPTIVALDRLWSIDVQPGLGFPDGGGVVTTVLVAGTLLSVLLGLLTASVVGQRERLGREVAERTRALARTNARLEEVGRLRSQFITTVSHELRTPLTAVIGFASTLRRIDPDDEELRDEMLRRIERNGVTLRRMIEELLDFGRIERGDLRLRLEPADVAGFVRERVADLAPSFEDVTIEVDAPDPAWAAIDRAATERVISNLCSNVQRYAPGADAVITVRTEGDRVVVRCADDGPGFGPDDPARLLERFVRGDGVMGEGTGIGLSLVDELVHGQHGTVDLATAPCGGAVVTLAFPAIPAPNPPVPVPVATRAHEDAAAT